MRLPRDFYKEQRFRDRLLKARKKDREKAEREIQKLEAANERAKKRARTGTAALKERIERMARHPSPSAVTTLRGMVLNKELPAEIRAKAAAVVLRWGEIGPVPAKPKRKRKTP